jgi:hypothetical protein
MLVPPFLRSSPSSLFAAALLLAGCSPEYKSGATVCAQTEPRCPDGLVCGGNGPVRRCYLPNEVPGGTPATPAAMGGGGVPGGVTPAMGGRGGSAPPSTPSTPSTPPATGGTPGMGAPPAGSFTPAQACAAFMPNSVCQQCTFSRCCSQQVACFHPTNADPRCKALLDCVDGCAETDDACFQRCTSANPAGVQLFSAFSECKDNSCTPPCGEAGSTPPPSTPPPSTPPPAGGFTPAPMCSQFMANSACQECTFSRCCSEQVTCFHPTNANPMCKALLDCLDTCADNDDACIQRCITSNQAGVQLLTTYLDCKDTKCVPPCPASASGGRPDETGTHAALVRTARTDAPSFGGPLGEPGSCALPTPSSVRKMVNEARSRYLFTPISGTH